MIDDFQKLPNYEGLGFRVFYGGISSGRRIPHTVPSFGLECYAESNARFRFRV